MSSVQRARWAAIGAVITIALGAGNILTTTASTTPTSSFVPTTPQRALDTRTNLGLPGPITSLQPRNLTLTG
ncbi:MAG: hypothetical protein JK586_12710, partial [Nocardiopsis sp. BM-2018]